MSTRISASVHVDATSAIKAFDYTGRELPCVVVDLGNGVDVHVHDARTADRIVAQFLAAANLLDTAEKRRIPDPPEPGNEPDEYAPVVDIAAILDRADTQLHDAGWTA